MCREAAWTELTVEVTSVVGVRSKARGLHKNEAEKQKNTVILGLAIIGAVAAVAAIAYAVYRFVTPDYLEDFEDDFDDDFDDYFSEDDQV